MDFAGVLVFFCCETLILRWRICDTRIRSIRFARKTHYFLALTLLENQNLEEAALFFEKSLEHDFEFASEIRWKLIEIYTKTKKYDRVVELYQFLIAEKSTEPKQVVQSVFVVAGLDAEPGNGFYKSPSRW